MLESETSEDNVIHRYVCIMRLKGLYHVILGGIFFYQNGRMFIHMLDYYINFIILNGINVFPLKFVLTCLPTSYGGSVVDYMLMKACDLSMVNAFKFTIYLLT